VFLHGEQFGGWCTIMLGLLTLGGAIERARIDRLAVEYRSDLEDAPRSEEARGRGTLRS
jgi:hypothetical protein